MQRVKTLKRILDVYCTLEEVRKTEAAIAAGHVREVEQAIGRQQEELLQSRTDEREAIHGGDDLAWAISSTRQESASLRRRSLAQLLPQRRQHSATAQQSYIESLQGRERIQNVVDATQAALKLESERREQADADDRYLAQRSSHHTKLQYER